MSMPPVIGCFRLLSGIVVAFFKEGRVSDHAPSFHWPVRGYFEDTDSGGIVYYASYLKFMERARTEWLRGRGIDVAEFARKDRVFFAVRSLELDYCQPGRLSDALRVSVVLERARRASLELWQEVTREDRPLCACVLPAWMPIPCKNPDTILAEL
uniref:4-hydroxybenzoyl-CoA thioesterase (YbgC) n=1 Tax=uncultured marine group II/III euryarchaeote KM3_86_F07 TaxID=1456529 RepID=A0A075HUM3_9EURY|nr:4-hydroxybenzoyl-CoA thioesterase (ybgC) [uncultured marine group II/III euryarchaeote KM3_86_F07]